MNFKTHLVIALIIGVILIDHVDNRVLFLLMLVIGAIAPDIDTKDSKLGKYLVFRPLQFIVKHRGIVHSLLFGFVISAILVMVYPETGFGFFLGFSSHIMLDSFTKEGVSPFYPVKKRISGFVKTGGLFELLLLIISSIILFIMVVIKLKVYS